MEKFFAKSNDEEDLTAYMLAQVIHASGRSDVSGLPEDTARRVKEYLDAISKAEKEQKRSNDL